jgi:hypothetical protein
MNEPTAKRKALSGRTVYTDHLSMGRAFYNDIPNLLLISLLFILTYRSRVHEKVVFTKHVHMYINTHEQYDPRMKMILF